MSGSRQSPTAIAARPPRQLGMALIAALLLTAAAGGPLAAQPPSAEASAQQSPERNYFSDVELINQHGERMRFYSDLLQGKTVIINSFFATCAGVCPVLSGKMMQIQDWLGDRLGDDVHLISITVDPETDTPERLKAFAESFKAKPGWYFLGGDRKNVDWALYKVGQYVENKEAHTNVLIVGNEPAKVWTKAFGLAPTRELIGTIDEILKESE